MKQAARPVEFDRLSPFELMYLRLERPEWPGHFGGLAVLEGSRLVGDGGRLRLDELRDGVRSRLGRVPQLRRRVHRPGWWGGRALWVDDDRFAIERHVHEVKVDPPGDDAALLAAAARIHERPLNRSRPLWELWFLSGVSEGRVGVVLKLHHALADGQAAVKVMQALFDLTPDAADPVERPWTPKPLPPTRALIVDNLVTRVRGLGAAFVALAHPMQFLKRAQIIAQVARKTMGVDGAPPTSLNPRVRAGRTIRFLRLDLAAVKRASHAGGGTVNDVVLALWAGGLRHLLLWRGEAVEGLEPTTGLPVSTRSATDEAIDNQVGTVVLPLPVWEEDVHRRLDLIIPTTRRAKTGEKAAAIMGAVARLATTPIGRYFMVRQRATNTLVTNVVGPPAPVYVLGAPILDILPMTDLTGNLGLTLCAFSYAGRLYLVVTADATGFPDVDRLMEGMERDWRPLSADRRQPHAAARSAGEH